MCLHKEAQTHRCFDISVRVRELWEVTRDVSWMCSLLPGRQRLGSHGGVRHWSFNSENPNTKSSRPRHEEIFQHIHTSKARRPALLLTGSDDHPLWTLGVHRQGVSVKTCRDTHIQSSPRCADNSHVGALQYIPISMSVTTVSDRVGTLLAVCSQ